MEPRTLTMLFRRAPSRDRQRDHICYEGYEILWPDGSPVNVALDAFCQHGQRLLGLGGHLAGRPQQLLDLLCFPLQSPDDRLTRVPGHRVRRFFLEREHTTGRLHFLDGTATDTVFKIDRDEPRVLQWIGLPSLPDGGRQWLDLAVRAAEVPAKATIKPACTPTVSSLSYDSTELAPRVVR